MNTPDRLPPFDLDSEQGVLGCCLLDSEALAIAIAHNIGPQFYDLRHREIFAHMQDMQDAGEPVDPITLQARLRNSGNLDHVGGMAYLDSLPDMVPSASNLEYYLKIVEEKFYARQVIQKAHDLVSAAYEDTAKLPALADVVESEIFALRHRLGVKQNSRQESFQRIIDRLEESSNTLKPPGVETGYGDLDKVLGGLRPKAMVTLAARPSMGKSSLAMNIAENLAVRRQIPVGFFSLEMSEDELNFRSIGSFGRLDMSEFNHRKPYEGEESNKLVDTVTILRKSPLHIMDRSDLTISQLRAEGRRLVSQQKVQLIVVDYLQLVLGTRKFENRTQEVSEVSRGLKGMAKELNIPVLALAQLNRDLEKDSNRRPRLSDLRESGSIEQDSDAVMFIWKPTDATGDKVTVTVAKNRMGATGEVSMIFMKQFTRFEQAAKVSNEDIPS